jgi:hypothetical protein
MFKDVYYAHSLRKYGTPAELYELRLLKTYFKHHRIFNPNCKKIWKYSYDSGMAMIKCLDVVKGRRVKALAFSTYLNFIGRGVYEEIITARREGKPIYIISKDKVEPFTGELEFLDWDWKIHYARIKEVPNGNCNTSS